MNYIYAKRDPYLDKGVSPRQRRVFVLRWNPSISSFTRDDFDNYMAQYQGTIPYDKENPLSWNVWDWKEVSHRDLFVMVQVGQEINGIVCSGFLGGFPFQYEKEDGKLSKEHFFELTVEFMQRIDSTKVLTIDKLEKAIPNVDWLHGHSGELLSVEDAEKLGLLMVNELKEIDQSEYLYFDDYNQKKYVLADILTFMCTELKGRLKKQGRISNKRLRNLHNLQARIDDEDYSSWDNIEEHLSLKKLNEVLL